MAPGCDGRFNTVYTLLIHQGNERSAELQESLLLSLLRATDQGNKP